ncbi:MAG: hypothetical protein HYW90_03180 [Candidatus Sungbacteria bacterium]|nr:hypothetical protein [Candidatus Sungbacteria bacterium]
MSTEKRGENHVEVHDLRVRPQDFVLSLSRWSLQPVCLGAEEVGGVMDEKKVRALMGIVWRIIGRHHRGLVVLDEPTFELFELAKRVDMAKTPAELKGALEALVSFNK